MLTAGTYVVLAAVVTVVLEVDMAVVLVGLEVVILGTAATLIMVIEVVVSPGICAVSRSGLLVGAVY